MPDKSALHIVGGVAIGACLMLGARSAGEQADAAPASRSKAAPTAVLTLTGDAGRYLQFKGRDEGLLNFKGNLAFRRSVTTGSYVLSLTLTSRSGKKSRLVYDIDARRR